ncbi:hypothetical protein [Mechercharimyces sp. CAU 1602]|uniref:hypothetical protein n=1 Tax=Mechercharimyces sp. CAU 1602 TaxID=2973933 RepID=UPI002162F411|nr:hypothetical protein [Mechercharimyces sp. CAU 1602]MCS1352623.1 hypothetical protein [Mechercharimyces sp. CAU 1602]
MLFETKYRKQALTQWKKETKVYENRTTHHRKRMPPRRPLTATLAAFFFWFLDK